MYESASDSSCMYAKYNPNVAYSMHQVPIVHINYICIYVLNKPLTVTKLIVIVYTCIIICMVLALHKSSNVHIYSYHDNTAVCLVLFTIVYNKY